MGRPLYGQALSFCSPAHKAQEYLFSAEAFSAEVLRYTIGAPLRLEHSGSRRCGTVRNIWTEPWALMFSAELDGDNAAEAAAMLDSPEHIGVSISPLFKHAGERVTEVSAITEVSLTTAPSCQATYARLGTCHDEPRRPITWWTGAPPLPPGLTASDRALLARGQGDADRGDALLTQADDNARHLKRITERLLRRGPVG